MSQSFFAISFVKFYVTFIIMCTKELFIVRLLSQTGLYSVARPAIVESLKWLFERPSAYKILLRTLIGWLEVYIYI